MKFAVLVLLVLAGCISTVPAQAWKASALPLTVVADPSMPPACQAATREAQLWWTHHADLTLETGLPGGKPIYGEIWVAYAPDALDAPSLGETVVETIEGEIVRAHITLGNCRAQTVAHELGHALGLGHNAAPDHLMYPVVGERWSL